MKRIILFFSVVFSVLMFSGCQTSEYYAKEQSHLSDVGNQIEASKGSDSTNQNSVEKLQVAYGAVWTPNQEDALSVFPFEPNIQEEQAANGTGKTIMDSHRLLAIGSGMLTYAVTDNELMHSVMYVFRNNQADSYYNADQFSTESDLSFCTRAGAISALKNILHRLGRTSEYDITCYALDKNTMNSQMEILTEAYGSQENVISEWGDDSECYYLEAAPIICDYPLLPLSCGSNSDGSQITAESIAAIFSLDGFEMVNIQNAVNVETHEDSQASILTEREAQDRFKKINSSLLSEETYTLQALRKGYYPQYETSDHTRVKFLPAWEATTLVSGESGRETGDSYEYVLRQYIDAQTGQEIVRSEE